MARHRRTWRSTASSRNAADMVARYRSEIRACCLTNRAKSHAPGCERHEKACRDKRAYATKNDAQMALAGFEPPEPRMQAYRCADCELFHLGHARVPA